MPLDESSPDRGKLVPVLYQHAWPPLCWRAGQKIRGEHLRLLLGLLVLAVGVRFAFELGIKPTELFTIRETAGAA